MSPSDEFNMFVSDRRDPPNKLGTVDHFNEAWGTRGIGQQTPIQRLEQGSHRFKILKFQTFSTFSGPEIIFLKTANDRNLIRVYQKI